MNTTSMLVFGSICSGFFMGTAWVSGMQNLEINRLNSALEKQQQETQKSQKLIETHKQFINRKGQLVTKFCKEYGAK